MKSTVISTAVLIAVSLLMFSCTKTENGPANTNLQPNVKKSPQTTLGGSGTSTAGGGGNGIDGRAIETYTKRIVDLPEYQNYILPILKKMRRDRDPDVLVAYLEWAATHKSWYFVPVALPQLPKDKVALAFESDQLALHSEREVFIFDGAYKLKSERDKASLLMHEMVMAARLLMKHSPQRQCEELGTTDYSNCHDPVLKAITAPNTDPKDDQTLGGEDHQAVRLLTEFLMTRGQDYSKESVMPERKRLRFIFAWDLVSSQRSSLDYLDAIKRATVSRQPFSLVSPKINVATTCDLGITYSTDTYLVSSVTFTSESATNLPTLPNPTNDNTRANYFAIQYFQLNESSTSIHPVIYSVGGKVSAIPGPDDIYDIVSWPQSSNYYSSNSSFDGNIFRDVEFVFSRSGVEPELVEFRVKAMRPLAGDGYTANSVEAKDFPRIRCVPTAARLLN